MSHEAGTLVDLQRDITDRGPVPRTAPAIGMGLREGRDLGDAHAVRNRSAMRGGPRSTAGRRACVVTCCDPWRDLPRGIAGDSWDSRQLATCGDSEERMLFTAVRSHETLGEELQLADVRSDGSICNHGQRARYDAALRSNKSRCGVSGFIVRTPSYRSARPFGA